MGLNVGIKINNNPKVIINICAKQGSNLRSLRNFLLREASYDHSTIRAKTWKKYIAPCGDRTRDPGLIRPKF